ncbi:UNVERIFIED_CONTAM: hypothetical protein FKN15_028858 [Acipenser sinensis]
MEILKSNTFFMNLMRNNAPVDLRYDYSSELFRMSTFAKFPASGAVLERSLARAGFYYTGVGDRVQCFRCKVTVENWQAGECPAKRHKRQSPDCPFVQGLASSSSLLSSSHSAFSPPLQSILLSQISNSTSPPLVEQQVGYFSNRFTSIPPSPLSSRSMEDVSQQRPATSQHPRMRREQDRLDTFQNWPLANITPSELAKAGFFYLGQGDRVACFSCGGNLSNWEPGDRAVSEHQRHYPSCRFARGDGTDNIPLPASITSLNVSNPAMQLCEERLLTFVSWPTRIPVRPDQLAKAGFYYVGRNDDVKCFCCDGGLRCWESGDDPWVEHAKWFPRCEYLLQEKGQDFVHQIQARFPRLFEQLLANGDHSSREFSDPTDGFTFLKRHRLVLIQRLKSVKSLMDHLREQSEITQKEYDMIISNSSVKQQTAQLLDVVLSKGNAPAEVFKNWIQKNDIYLLRDLMDMTMEEQLRRLQEERTCKVCMDKEVNIVFIPCGHLVVCKECAPSLRKCPICRGMVKGTVRTFLS